MITRGNSFNLLYPIYHEDTKYMTIFTRQERERFVIKLYNQGKTYREIAKEARISPRDIGAILNKVIEEKTEGLEEEDNIDSEKKQNQEEEQQRHLSLSAQAYKLFYDRKTPLEVAIELNLGESEATKFYKEYWKLKQLHNLTIVYEETKGDIEPFLKLYRLSKAKGMSVKQVVNLLTIANNDLPALEKRIKRLRNDVSTLQFGKQTLERNLYGLNNQIASTTKLFNSYRISCIREKREIRKLYNEKARLEALIEGFKSNNEEYLEIKQAAEEKVKSVLTDSRLTLKFATLSVIQSLRMNPELYNFVIHDNSNNTTIGYRFNYPSLMSSGKQQQQEQSFNDTYTALILEEAEKLYNKLITQFTNGVITATATIRESSLSLPTYNNNRN
jgi:transposase